MVKRNKPTVTVTLGQVGPRFWKNMGMDVVGAVAHSTYHSAYFAAVGGVITDPHESQVRASVDSLKRFITGGN